MPKFVAEFYEEYGKGFDGDQVKTDQTNERLMLAERKVLDYKLLKPSTKTSKPQSTFNYKHGTYLFTDQAIQAYDKKGKPILHYKRNQILPLEFGNKINGEKLEATAQLYNEVSARMEMSNVIKGAFKSTPKMDLMTTIIVLLAGVGVGYIIKSFIH